jgi:SP family myo-inositol transporter-like MFS transporter 13
MTAGFLPSSSTKEVPLKKQKFTPIVFIATCLSAIGCLLFGYDTGIVSGSMIFIKDEFFLNSFWQELEVSITIIGACIFSGFSGPSSNRLGRKKVILTAAFVFTVGSIIMAVAWEKYSLLVGRFIAGAGIGFASTVVPMYIAEIAPIQYRGSLVTMAYVFIVLGQLIAALVAGACSYMPAEVGWRYMLGIAAVPAGIQFLGFIFMPESPRWLIQKKKYDAAVKQLRRIRGTEDVSEEFDAIRDECDEAEKMESNKQSCFFSLIDAWKERSTRRALIVGTILWATHEFSGINIMMYYTATIVQMAGVYDKTMAVWIAAAIDVVYVICTSAGIYLVEKMGRRALLLTSLVGVIISLALTGGGFMLAEETAPSANLSLYDDPMCGRFLNCKGCMHSQECGFCFQLDGDQWSGHCIPSNLETEGVFSLNGSCVQGTQLTPDRSVVWAYDWCPSDYSWVILMAMTIYLAFFGPGIGAMPWTINSEIFPLHARSACTAYATGVKWFTNILVTATFLTLTEVLGKAGTFWLYGVFAITGATLLFLLLPETKGKSLEETSKLFQRRTCLVVCSAD